MNDSNPYGELLLLSGSGNPELSERIAREMGVKLADVEITRFADGEFDVKIRESVRGHDVFLVQHLRNLPMSVQLSHACGHCCPKLPSQRWREGSCASLCVVQCAARSRFLLLPIPL